LPSRTGKVSPSLSSHPGIGDGLPERRRSATRAEASDVSAVPPRAAPTAPTGAASKADGQHILHVADASREPAREEGRACFLPATVLQEALPVQGDRDKVWGIVFTFLRTMACPGLRQYWPELPLPAGQIGGLYRALRKRREDAKDEPDAADSYYGEMELRRHAGRPTTDGSTGNPTGEVYRGQVERAILTVYWLVSGYGLRAWQTLAWLAAVTAVFAVAFHLAGFARPPQQARVGSACCTRFAPPCR
jgi:hypothetical protein